MKEFIWFIVGFISASTIISWFSIFNISSKESLAEEKKLENKKSKENTFNPPANYCGEEPIGVDPKWNLFDGD